MRHLIAKQPHRALCRAGLATLSLSAFATAGGIVDNFESYAAGTFPAANWQDTGPISPTSLVPPPNPSCTVGTTLDAFGNPTQALHLDPSWVGSASGIYRAVPSDAAYSLRMDVRTDQFATGATGNASDWPWMMGVSRFDANTQAGGWNSLQMYGTDLSQDFRAYAIHSGGADDFPLGVLMQSGVWYSVQIDVDATTGTIRNRIWNTASNALLADATVTASAWTAADGVFDVVTINQGEISATGSADTWIDNVVVRVVPEPAALALLMLAGIALRRRG
ncbi:MAG: PEP-CTERM sorting domain-containing protein [Phycisphaerae bacterium]|nr:PEP-CTERM sorting domain-containing protein [Phycisphaerae bacterium]